MGNDLRLVKRGNRQLFGRCPPPNADVFQPGLWSMRFRKELGFPLLAYEMRPMSAEGDDPHLGGVCRRGGGVLRSMVLPTGSIGVLSGVDVAGLFRFGGGH